MENFVLRQILPLLEMALDDTPVVLLNGPRQSGKTTLARHCWGDRPYYSLDDLNILHMARSDPMGFIGRLESACIDEIQQAPELLRAIKLSVDKDRRPGRFLLTGSADILSLAHLPDSLAGRMEVLTLFPFSQREIGQLLSGQASLGTLSFLDQCQRQDWVISSLCQGEDLYARVLIGGYPNMLQRRVEKRRHAWAQAYIQAIMQHDLYRGEQALEKTMLMPSLLHVLALHTAQMLNSTQIGASLHVDLKTVQKYIGLLERLFLVQRLRPWGRNEIGRLIKSPKIHFYDTGLQSSLIGLTLDEVRRDRMRFGATLESWVFSELTKAIHLSPEIWTLYYYRDRDQYEVDFVLENAQREIIGIEVKAAATIYPHDFKGLRKLAALAPEQWRVGLILYDGDQILSFGPGLWAIPLSVL